MKLSELNLWFCFSWNPVVYPEFRVDPKLSYKFSIWLVPLSGPKDEASVISREDPPSPLI